jgi:hypothetical protein
MYRESMHAALTLAEVRATLARSRLAECYSLSGYRGLDWIVTASPTPDDVT